jgi:hypothetical protein
LSFYTASRAAAMPRKTPPKNPAHRKMPVHRNKSAQKNTTPMVAKLDESVEIRPESPDVNLEIGLDISVVRNTTPSFS